jgi:hypothetical protein
MADTGNPWFIPFAEPSDLVRDWPALSSAVGTAVAAGLSGASNAGIGTNVVQGFSNTTQTASVASGGETVISSLSAVITPTSETSKILVIANISAKASGSAGVSLTIKRNGTAISVGSGLSSQSTSGGGASGVARGNDGSTAVVLDSPNTTSAVTYTVAVTNNDNVTRNLFINRAETDDVNRNASRIIVIEVKA